MANKGKDKLYWIMLQQTDLKQQIVIFLVMHGYVAERHTAILITTLEDVSVITTIISLIPSNA